MSERVSLVDGRKVGVMALKPEDAGRLHRMLQSLSQETMKWSMAPYQLEWVERWLNTPALIQVAAECEGDVVGFACIEEWTHPKRRGTGYLRIYVHRDFHDTELQSRLIRLVIDEACKKGLHKINTETVSANAASVRLLGRHGFEVEGTKRDCFYGLDGYYYDTVIMGKILE